MPEQLPGAPADLTAADAALATMTDPGAMAAALKRVHKQRDEQVERVAAAGRNLDAAQAVLTEAERAHQTEAADMKHLDRTIARHQETIDRARAQRAADKERRAFLARQAEARRRRKIEDGLIALGQQA